MQPEIDILPPAPVTMSGRCILFATCHECDYRAKVTADTEPEADAVARWALTTHMAEQHGRPPPG